MTDKRGLTKDSLFIFCRFGKIVKERKGKGIYKKSRKKTGGPWS
jgi:hypothetical protein